MLRNRIITALILAPVVLGGVCYLNAFWFGLMFWTIAAFAMYEWAGLLELQGKIWRWVYVACFGLVVLAIHGLPVVHEPLLFAGLLIWLLAACAVLLFPRFVGLFRSPWLLGPLGLAIGGIAWLALTRIHALPEGSWWLLWMFVLVWGADVGAYFAGKQFGQRRLAPEVSPGKTWEGALGGLLLAGIVCGTAVMLWQDSPFYWLAVCIFLIGVSIFGDLFESLLKRATGVKDSGTILPGHGGMLDRIDSILAVVPVLAVVLT